MSGTIGELAESLTRGREAGESLSLKLADCVIRIDSDSRPLIQALADYFRSVIAPAGSPAEIRITALETAPPEIGIPLTVKQPDPGKTKIKEEFADLPDGRVVRKRLTGMAFLFGGPVNLALGPCLANSNQVINFVNNRFIQRELSAGSLLAHAAAVAGQSRGLALAGFSGMGKSTLALWLTGRGLDFISNDRLLVKPSPDRLAMAGVAKQPRINPGTALANPALSGIVPEEERKRFAALPPEELWALEHKYDAIIEDCFGPGRFRLAAPLDGLAILNWRRGEGSCRVRRVDLAQRLDLLAAFKKEPGLFFLDQGGGEADILEPTDQAYLEALSRTAVFEISGGVDFQTASDALLGFLDLGLSGETG